MATIKDRLYELNKAFQKLYHDEHAQFFNSEVPKKFDEIRELIREINIRHPEMKGSFRGANEIIDNSLDLMEGNDKPDMATSDMLLNTAKNNFSHAIWKVHERLSTQILNEEI